VFFDSSPTGRRRWCDMATCGNRAKAARHRARAKATELDTAQVEIASAPAARA
jgi:predicted RNA-binding Zn ribbon-like protein